MLGCTWLMNFRIEFSYGSFEHDNKSLFNIKAGKRFDQLSNCRRLLNKNSVKWGWLVIHAVLYPLSPIYALAKVCRAFVLMYMGILLALLDTNLMFLSIGFYFLRETFKADSHIACRSHAAPMPFPWHAVLLKADSHIACRAHAVSLPCRAAKGGFTHSMPRPCRSPAMPCC
jgi:hypothetical protein